MAKEAGDASSEQSPAWMGTGGCGKERAGFLFDEMARKFDCHQRQSLHCDLLDMRHHSPSAPSPACFTFLPVVGGGEAGRRDAGDWMLGPKGKDRKSCLLSFFGNRTRVAYWDRGAKGLRHVTIGKG